MPRRASAKRLVVPQSPDAAPSALSIAEVTYTGFVREAEAACLARLAEDWGLPLTPEMAGRVLGFCRLLVQWNSGVNLTGAQSVAEVIGEHVVDSFAMARLVPQGSSLVDVGTGGVFLGCLLPSRGRTLESQWSSRGQSGSLFCEQLCASFN